MGAGNSFYIYIYALGQRRTSIHEHDQDRSSTVNRVAARELARIKADKEG